MKAGNCPQYAGFAAAAGAKQATQRAFDYTERQVFDHRSIVVTQCEAVDVQQITHDREIVGQIPFRSKETLAMPFARASGSRPDPKRCSVVRPAPRQ